MRDTPRSWDPCSLYFMMRFGRNRRSVGIHQPICFITKILLISAHFVVIRTSVELSSLGRLVALIYFGVEEQREDFGEHYNVL